MEKPHKKRWLVAVAVLIMAALGGCDEIDCTLNNYVLLRAGFYVHGDAVSLTDTISVTSGRQGPVLLNKQVGAVGLELSMSYWQDCDTLVMTVNGENYTMTDTIWLEKTNQAHFESPDCPTTMFHKLTAARCTHQFIDSVTIVQPDVNYAQPENIQIHILSAD